MSITTESFMKALLIAALSAAVLTATAVPAAGAEPLVTVYKSPTCGCCGEWVKHLRKSGFDVRVHEVPDATPFSERYGVPRAMRSCHTALVGGYTIEGHVPASDIKRLLSERPRAKGLAAPGMPQSAPGMDDPRKIPYETLLFDSAGKSVVYERH